MSNRSVYESSVKTAQATALASLASAHVAFQTTIDSANSVVGYNLQTGNNVTLRSNIATANAARLEAYANAEKARQAAHAAARDTLRSAGGDTAAF